MIFTGSETNFEIWPHYSIFDLCLKSVVIHEAKFLKEDVDDYIFVAKKIGSQGGYTDTIVFENVKSVIAEDLQVAEEREVFDLYKEFGLPIQNSKVSPTLKNSEKVIFFSCKNGNGDLIPIASGYRLIKKNIIYGPSQRKIPGEYWFDKTNINPKELFEEIEECQRKINKLVSLFDDRNSTPNRLQYQKWIDKVSIEFSKSTDSEIIESWGIIGNYLLLEMRKKPKEAKINHANLENFLRKNTVII